MTVCPRCKTQYDGNANKCPKCGNDEPLFKEHGGEGKKLP